MARINEWYKTKEGKAYHRKYANVYYHKNKEKLNIQRKARDQAKKLELSKDPALAERLRKEASQKKLEWRRANPDKDKANRKRYRIKNPEKVKTHNRNSLLKREYGITQDVYDLTLETQNGACALCFRPNADTGKQKLNVDHCHESGKFRGLLCGKCNRGLGAFNDDIDLMERAFLYLKKHKGNE